MPRTLSAAPGDDSRQQRAAARLTVQTTRALAELVSTLQAQGGERSAPRAGLAYKMVRGVPRQLDPDFDALLNALVPLLATPDAADGDGQARQEDHRAAVARERTSIRAALNGLLGDHLARTANPLAIGMSLQSAGRPLELERDALAAALPAAGDKPLVLIHDLCRSDLQWRHPIDEDEVLTSAHPPRAEDTPPPTDAPRTHDHGAALADALGFTPVYLHYNSGLHVSTNGRALAAKLERLLHAWPRPIARFAIVGHGMGGLLARSALHYAKAADHHWPHRLDDLVSIGTPHHGLAPEPDLDLLIARTPHADVLKHLIALGSPGVTDLCHGNLLDEDWLAGDRRDRAIDRRVVVALPAGVRCHAVAGNGLVPAASALGRHRIIRRTLKLAPDLRWTAAGVDHLGLLASSTVFEQLRRWLRH